MPNDDRDGRPLKEGETVLVPCVIRRFFGRGEWSNVELLTVEPMHPGKNQTALTLNTKQVVRADAMQLQEPAADHAAADEVESESAKDDAVAEAAGDPDEEQYASDRAGDGDE